MPVPSLDVARQYASEPSVTKLLVEEFGCIALKQGVVMCPDGVERHAHFRGIQLESAAERYLTWEVVNDLHRTTVSLDGPIGQVLNEHHRTETVRVGIQGVIDHYDPPVAQIDRSRRMTFNGAPARTVSTRGRLCDEVTTVHRALVQLAQTDQTMRRGWREEFAAVPDPKVSPYKLPDALKPIKPSKPPARRAFEPRGFYGRWFTWTDERDGVTYECQVQGPGPRPGHVWIAGIASEAHTTALWLGRLEYPAGFRGPYDGSKATTLHILATDEEWQYRGTLATIGAP